MMLLHITLNEKVDIDDLLFPLQYQDDSADDDYDDVFIVFHAQNRINQLGDQTFTMCFFWSIGCADWCIHLTKKTYVSKLICFSTILNVVIEKKCDFKFR